VLAVRLIRRRHHHLLDGGAASAGLKQAPSTADVGLEGGKRVPVRDADDRLTGQVEDGVDLVFPESAFQERLVANVAADGGDAVNAARPNQLASRHPIAHQAHHVGAPLQQDGHQPRAQ